MPEIRIVPATDRDIPVLLGLIRGLAEYERLSHEVEATEDRLRRTLFGERPAAEALLAYDGVECVGFAVFFTNYSTFLAKPGLYLEDVFVVPHARRRGIGVAILKRLAAIALERDYGRMNWSVLDWNKPAVDFYKKLGAEVFEDWRVCRVTRKAMVDLVHQVD
jgi:GNAT superfamily N-acetyltransferase